MNTEERIYIIQFNGNTVSWTTNQEEINKYFERLRNENNICFSYETKIDLLATIYNFKLN